MHKEPEEPEGVRPANQQWITRIFCEEHGVNVSKLEEIASDIAQSDNTFKYRIEEGDLVIISEDKDTAYQRGEWFAHNTDQRLEQLVKSGEDVYEVDWEEKGR